MATTMKTIRKALDPEEPNYVEAQKIGPGALPHLKKLVEGDDILLAAKATYLAGLIGTKESVEILNLASRNTIPEIRIAAAASVHNITQRDAANQILLRLLSDKDWGVCRIALKSTGPWVNLELIEHVENLRKNADQKEIREAAEKAIKRILKVSRKPIN